MKRLLSLILSIVFVCGCFSSVGVMAADPISVSSNTGYVTTKGNGPSLIATHLITDSSFYNYGYECIKVSDYTYYSYGYETGSFGIPVTTSVTFIYSDYEVPGVHQVYSYFAVGNVSKEAYVYSQYQYTVKSAYVYHKINQGANANANYTNFMIFSQFEF